jgi:transcriptional regulator with PAS, ATPase and Fis domain
MPEEEFQFLGLPAVFASARSRELLEKARHLARMNSAVLIEGESGSGKEVLARVLHAESTRSSKPWVDVSCAALPEHLVESELFGYEKGAFSGAETRKEGLFELAHCGTLFLDEIGELAPRLQAKLLRVLDSGSYFRLGGTKKVHVDVRIISATNRDLREAVASGEFRKDLYYRLAQVRLRALPLRERTEDILPMARLFLAEQGQPLALSEDVSAALLSYAWPGNAREIRNAMISAAAMATGKTVEMTDLPEEIQQHFASTGDPGLSVRRLADVLSRDGVDSGSSAGVLAELERKTILEVLRDYGGHQERAARVLGISSRTLSRKLKSYEVSEHESERPALGA